MRARLVPVLLALAVAAGGCSEGEDPQTGPTLPPITESPSPTAEAVPSEATEATAEGAAEFARFFVNEVYEGYVSRDPERVSRLSSPDCETCQRYIASISSIAEQDATIGDDYRVEILDAAAPTLEPGVETTNVTVVLRIGEFVVTDPSGAELVREEAADQVVQDIALARAGDSWQVTGVIVS